MKLNQETMENNINNCFENGNILATQKINRFQIGVIFHDQISRGFGNDDAWCNKAKQPIFEMTR